MHTAITLVTGFVVELGWCGSSQQYGPALSREESTN
jgi:hypothetical protein